MMLGLLRHTDLEPIFQRGAYERLRETAMDTSTWVKQIDLDINRTFRDNLIYAKRYGSKYV